MKNNDWNTKDMWDALYKHVAIGGFLERFSVPADQKHIELPTLITVCSQEEVR